MNPTRRAHATMILASLLIATSFPVVGAIAGELDSVLLTLLRFGLASILFLPLVAWRHGRDMLPSGSRLVRYAGMSALLVAFFVAMFEALRTTTPVNTGALITFGPSFSALFAFFLVRERLGKARILALVTGMVGALWVVARGDLGGLLELELAVGDAIFVAGTASFGLYTVLIKRVHRGEPMAVMTFWILVTGSGWLLLVGGRELVALDWGAIPPRVIGATLYLALFTTLVTFMLSQSAVTVIGPTRTTAYNYLNPALVALLAWALGQGSIEPVMLPGIALTLVSMVVLQREGASQPSVHTAPSCHPFCGELEPASGAVGPERAA